LLLLYPLGTEATRILQIQRQKGGHASLSDILRSISDDKSLSIFQLIGDVNSNGEIILKKLGLRRRQFYSKMSAMMATDLIKRQKGIYTLTPFGKVIYCCIMIAQSTLKNYYNLNAVESIQGSGFSNEDLSKLVNTLIDNQQVKEFLGKKC
jgi:hypothetical protein